MKDDFRTQNGRELPSAEQGTAGDERREDEDVEAERLEQTVAAGADAVRDDDEITAVHVVLPKGSSYRKLLRSRRYERPGELRVTVREDCGVTIQLRHDGISAPPTNDPVPSLPSHRPRLSWPQAHEPAWLQRLKTMTEGVR